MSVQQLVDWMSGSVIVLGGLLTFIALVRYMYMYRHGENTRWTFRAVAMLATVEIVWLGSAVTLLGKTGVLSLETAQWLAFGSRLTLLALIIWLVALPHIPDDHGGGSLVKGHHEDHMEREEDDRNVATERATR